MSGLGKIVRALIGIAVIAVLLVTVNGWYGEYKNASRVKKTASTEASGSVNSTQVVAVVGGKTVAVLTDGVVLHTTPAASAAAVRTLKKGEQLILMGTTVSGWLQLRDSKDGKMGYVVNNTANVQVQK
ncbi:MAG: SH3 domain-containing protein [Coriobacteriia bacterium]|nr:SH3 domain-containing protein [Coriobacteriia bacterium]